MASRISDKIKELLNIVFKHGIEDLEYYGLIDLTSWFMDYWNIEETDHPLIDKLHDSLIANEPYIVREFAERIRKDAFLEHDEDYNNDQEILDILFDLILETLFEIHEPLEH